jgi:uncharacterized protein YifE (UPF0438 family)
MTVKFGNSKELTFATGGRLKNVQYADAWVHTEDVTIAEAELALKKGNGVMVDELGKLRTKRFVERAFIA